MKRQEAIIGVKVVFHWNHKSSIVLYPQFENQIGAIKWADEWNAQVMFFQPITHCGDTRAIHICSLDYLHAVFMTPEEEAIYQEQLRQAEEQQLDQQRRQQHAAKYL